MLFTNIHMPHIYPRLDHLSNDSFLYIIHLPPYIPSSLLPITAIHQPLNLLRNRQTAGQPRTLDPQQIDPPHKPIFPPDPEIPRRNPLSPQLRPDAAVVDFDAVRLHGGQVLSDVFDGEAPALGVRVGGEVEGGGGVGGREPLDVGAEADGAGDVEGEVGAEAAEAGDGGGVE